MATRPSLIFFFSVAFAFFVLVPPFLERPFPGYPLMHWGDAVDLVTPLFLLPLYWLLFTDAGRVSRGRLFTLAFLVLGALWTLGQGMHLGANSISNLFGTGTSPVHDLIHFYDEVLSHYVWHAAMIGMSLILVSGRTQPVTPAPRRARGLIMASGLLYGFAFFAAVNEGGTVPLGLPASIIIPAAMLGARRRELGRWNLTTFFVLGYLVALAFFVGWYSRWGGFPQFSEKGML